MRETHIKGVLRNNELMEEEKLTNWMKKRQEDQYKQQVKNDILLQQIRMGRKLNSTN